MKHDVPSIIGANNDLHQLEDKIQLLKTVIEDTNDINIHSSFYSSREIDSKSQTV